MLLKKLIWHSEELLVSRHNKLFNFLGTDVQWSGVSLWLMYILMFLTLIVMVLERSDFTGLVLSATVWYIFIQQSGLSMLDYVKKFTIGTFSAAGYDFLWLFFHNDVS